MSYTLFWLPGRCLASLLATWQMLCTPCRCLVHGSHPFWLPGRFLTPLLAALYMTHTLLAASCIYSNPDILGYDDMGPAARAQHDRFCTPYDMEYVYHDKSSNCGHCSTWEVERERGKKSDKRLNWRSEKRSDWRSDQKSRQTSSCKDEKQPMEIMAT